MRGCFFHSGDGESLNAQLDARVASGKLTLSDADTVREFAAFLTAIAPYPKGEPLPLTILREYQEFIGISDEELAAIEARRGA